MGLLPEPAVPHASSPEVASPRARPRMLTTWFRAGDSSPTRDDVKPDFLTLLVVGRREPFAHRLAEFFVAAGVRLTSVEQINTDHSMSIDLFDCLVLDLEGV